MNFQKLAATVCVPYCVLFVVCILFFPAYSVIAAFNATTLGSVATSWLEVISSVMLCPILLAYYFVPSVLGIGYFTVAQAVIVAAWRQAATRQHRGRLIFYNIILIAYIGYIIWWFATKQQFSYL
jgi:hypothetical protein